MQKNSAIQGLRGLAVLAVFVYHVHRSIATGPSGAALDRSSLAFHALEAGRLGVDLFFMISGYLITASLLKHRSALGFLQSRAIRVYPAFLAPHLIVFAVGPLIGYAWMRELRATEYLLHFVSNLLFLPGIFPLPIAQVVAWSLSYETAFYLLAAAAMRIATLRTALAVRSLLWTLWTGSAGLILWHHPRTWFFVAGVLAHLLVQTAGHGRPAKAPLAALAFPALLLMVLLFDRAFPLAVVCGLMAFSSTAAQCGPLSRSLQCRPLRFMGEISYSFYLWHTLVLFILKRVVASTALGGSPVWSGILLACAGFAGSLATAYLSWALIEQWFTTRWLRPESPFPDAQAIAEWSRALREARLESEARRARMDETSGRPAPRVHIRAAGREVHLVTSEVEETLP